jgi:hypothetical protein
MRGVAGGANLRDFGHPRKHFFGISFKFMLKDETVPV